MGKGYKGNSTINIPIIMKNTIQLMITIQSNKHTKQTNKPTYLPNLQKIRLPNNHKVSKSNTILHTPPGFW